MRFVNFFERDFSSAIYNFSCNFIENYILKIKDTKWQHFKWKGLSLLKDPMSITIYMQLLQDIKPKTILEFGTYEGGTALWISDIMKSINEKCIVHTFDINSEQVKLLNIDNVFFHQLDVFKIKDFINDNQNLFNSLEHPILVIEDCHENVLEVLESVDVFLKKEDYLIIEDTIDYNKHQILSTYLQNKNYVVDCHYCDFWGHNNSWNFNSILKKQ